jgi:hypothetical protein
MIANVLGLCKQRRPWSSGKRHHHLMKKNLARLAWDQSLCDLRTDLVALATELPLSATEDVKGIPILGRTTKR